jgi:dipeptidase D
MYSTLESSPVAGLKPELFWKHFYEITKIPRGSGNEKAAGDYIVQCAERLKLLCKRDEAGNVVVSKPGTKGHEKAPGVILQSHLDMVCEKNKDVVFDFLRDPIILVRDGDYITARGTSLGADNGVGVAASLAVLESGDGAHPPIECLFTTDEETGMTGAKGLKGDALIGRRLLNLDSEEEGDIYVGCSGGSDNQLHLPVKRIPAPPGTAGVKVKVQGLKGGHSGLDIHEGRGNAIKLLGRFLWNLKNEMDFHLASFQGGSKRNAIPREAEVHLALDNKNLQDLNNHAARWEKVFLDEFTPLEEHLKVLVEPADAPGQVMGRESMERFIDLISVIPHGVLVMSRTIKDLVETSTNLAIVSEKVDTVTIELSHRSSSASSLISVDQRTEALARQCNLQYEKGGSYPGWQPNMKSTVLNIASKTYQGLFGKDVQIKAIHAGLECGLIGEKFPGMDMISFGPTLSNVHSPDEKLNIPSVELFWKFLVKLLETMA